MAVEVEVTAVREHQEDLEEVVDTLLDLVVLQHKELEQHHIMETQAEPMEELLLVHLMGLQVAVELVA
jgi:hypothetical protein